MATYEAESFLWISIVIVCYSLTHEPSTRSDSDADSESMNKRGFDKENEHLEMVGSKRKNGKSQHFSFYALLLCFPFMFSFYVFLLCFPFMFSFYVFLLCFTFLFNLPPSGPAPFHPVFLFCSFSFISILVHISCTTLVPSHSYFTYGTAHLSWSYHIITVHPKHQHLSQFSFFLKIKAFNNY
ncbi:hypothetical protein VCUG_02427 [Vavraia culicis subsp. floridensis]|uniref:Uncharacterized protein n=1 Tax=Vavraia culicis (isolate floridensis) TaxID=948595 RepID=L2GRT5_VAVCU|nr:uncharacterized protein VCUG_02427 [Vavraia culicis subsp. floridensis]ELA46092.1 hypothetical protein VCUG_02427 [Vavraia culicis subsp. floridensis]